MKVDVNIKNFTMLKYIDEWLCLSMLALQKEPRNPFTLSYF